jgi:hypothetical protein
VFAAASAANTAVDKGYTVSAERGISSTISNAAAGNNK